MPTVLLINGHRFYFYLNEHEPIQDTILGRYDTLIDAWRQTFGE